MHRSAPTGNSTRRSSHGASCSQAHASIPTSRRLSPLPWRTSTAPRRPGSVEQYETGHPRSAHRKPTAAGDALPRPVCMGKQQSRVLRTLQWSAAHVRSRPLALRDRRPTPSLRPCLDRSSNGARPASAPGSRPRGATPRDGARANARTIRLASSSARSWRHATPGGGATALEADNLPATAVSVGVSGGRLARPQRRGEGIDPMRKPLVAVLAAVGLALGVSAPALGDADPHASCPGLAGSSRAGQPGVQAQVVFGTPADA